MRWSSPPTVPVLFAGTDDSWLPRGGLIGQVTLNRMLVPPEWRVAIAVGFFGGYTTFSSFGWETAKMMESGEWLRASTYVISSVILGLLLSAAGIRLANRF